MEAELLKIAKARTSKEEFITEILKANRESLIAYLCKNYSEKDVQILNAYHLI